MLTDNSKLIAVIGATPNSSTPLTAHYTEIGKF